MQLLFLPLFVSLAAGLVSVNVSFPSDAPSGLLNIEGTVTAPDTQGPYPAIVLVGGSGPSNRDEAGEAAFFNWIIGKKPLCSSSSLSVAPFADLATAFAAQGIVTLRYDKRACLDVSPHPCNYTAAEVNFNLLTMADFAIDAAAAIDYVASLPYVDATRVTVAGHSQGSGVVLPAITLANTRVKQAVQLMGVAVNTQLTVLEEELRNVMVVGQGRAACTLEGNTLGASQLAAAEQRNWLTFQSSLNLQASLYDHALPADKPLQCVDQAGTNCVRAAFEYSQSNYTGVVAQTQHMQSFAAGGGRLLTLNSPQDTLITPAIYGGIQLIAANIDGCIAEEFPNIVHELVPNDGSSASVDPKLAARLATFVLAGK